MWGVGGGEGLARPFTTPDSHVFLFNFQLSVVNATSHLTHKVTFCLCSFMRQMAHSMGAASPGRYLRLSGISGPTDSVNHLRGHVKTLYTIICIIVISLALWFLCQPVPDEHGAYNHWDNKPNMLTHGKRNPALIVGPLPASSAGS